MIITKIEINNFRSYYRSNVFDLSDGLNLIIGSNGDGKTTFYEALEWVFRTDGTNLMDSKYVSKKRAEELFADESDDVRVAVTYNHKGRTKTLEKTFHFTKSFDGSISTSNFSFILYDENGVEREALNGVNFDKDFPVYFRKYTMFKGESELDFFQQSNALHQLVETFGDVKDFETYFKFMEIATEKADKARDHQQSLDKKNSDKIKSYKRTIETEQGILSEIDGEIRRKSEDVVRFDKLLRDLEKNKEASQQLHTVNRRIETLTQKRQKIAEQIQENYTVSLLDNKWILLGFEGIANEYSEKISSVDKKRRKLEQDYLLEMGAHKVIKKMQTDFVPLPVHIPGPKIMQEMLDEEVCKICGRKAPKHSDAWEFMLHKLEEYRASLNADDTDDIPPFYSNNYIGEIQKKDTTLTDHLDEITTLRHKILWTIAANNKLHEDIKKIDANINIEFEQKKRILAHTDGLSEDQLINSYENISNWVEGKNRADSRIKVLKSQREQHKQNLDDAQAKLNGLAEGTSAAVYSKISIMLRHISESFKSAKETNKKQLLHAIEDEANHYLECLNTNDFKGTIRIIEKGNGQGEAILMNSDDTRIYNPNTALRTTYLMSVLFAIGKLSGQRDNTEFPLLFDAPTSSFTEAKETQFFNVIASLGKQVIIVTKSFLTESNGNVVLDYKKINAIKGRVFRIEKKKPFDDKNLSTIQTVISRYK